MKKGKKKLWIFVAVIGLICAMLAILIWKQTAKMRKDFDRLQKEEYDTLVMSMYPLDNYDEGDYMHYRGMDAVQMAFCIPNGKIMRRYMNEATESGNTINRAYIGVDPEHATKEDIVIMIQQNPEILFEVTLAYPRIDYWTEMKEEKFKKVMEEYQLFAEWIIPLENANLYSFSSEEWLIGNSENYVDTFNTNAEVSEFLMCNTDEAHAYGVTFDNVQSKFDCLRALYEKYRNNPVEYPNAENMDIVFFGDSIIGNYTDSLSVPGVVKGLSGARVYNCGFGGKTAASMDDTKTSFPDLADAFLNRDLINLPIDSQVYAGINSFMEDEHENRSIMFVVNYGLNDYFYGIPTETEVPNDITSYSGAMRTAIEKLKKAYPQAQILVMTPHFTINYNFGADKAGEAGGILEDYANVILKLEEELDIDVLDNFHEFVVTEENWKTYQQDGTHLNEIGRFLLGDRIAQQINSDS